MQGVPLAPQSLCISQGSKLLIIFCISLSAVPFVVTQCLPTGLHARYTYESWNSSTMIWKNTVGPGRDAIGSGSGFSTVCRTNENGASGRVCQVSGTTTSVLRFGTMPSVHTICTVARYSGSSRKRIFTSDGVSRNWLHGFWNIRRGVAYNEAWMTSSTNLIPATETDWLVFCGQNKAPDLYYANDMSVGSRQDQIDTGNDYIFRIAPSPDLNILKKYSIKFKVCGLPVPAPVPL
jgi:hypothetical protein